MPPMSKVAVVMAARSLVRVALGTTMNFEPGVIIPMPQLKRELAGLPRRERNDRRAAGRTAACGCQVSGASRMRPQPAASLASIRHSTGMPCFTVKRFGM